MECRGVQKTSPLEISLSQEWKSSGTIYEKYCSQGRNSVSNLLSYCVGHVVGRKRHFKVDNRNPVLT